MVREKPIEREREREGRELWERGMEREGKGKVAISIPTSHNQAACNSLLARPMGMGINIQAVKLYTISNRTLSVRNFFLFMNLLNFIIK